LLVEEEDFGQEVFFAQSGPRAGPADPEKGGPGLFIEKKPDYRGEK